MVKVIVLFWISILSSSAFAAQDPTKPLGWQAPTEVTSPTTTKRKARPSKPVLQSIVCDQHHQCSAVINNVALTVGQRVSGYRVQSIHSDSVVLNRHGRNIRLSLYTKNIKIAY